MLHTAPCNPKQIALPVAPTHTIPSHDNQGSSPTHPPRPHLTHQSPSRSLPQFLAIQYYLEDRNRWARIEMVVCCVPNPQNRKQQPNDGDSWWQTTCPNPIPNARIPPPPPSTASRFHPQTVCFV
uniref:Uncharacterized protein n=1 Tax=Proboscia inermis TaxID=420281 RepID=A0A7S0CKY4_9STRA